MYRVIQVQLSLFVKIGTFPEQIAIIDMFSKLRIFTDCACSQRANFPRDIMERRGIPLSYLPWNWIRGFSHLNIESIVRLFISLSYASNVRTRVSKDGTTPQIPEKYASNDDWFQLILTFICCNTWASSWEKVFSGSTIFTINSRTLDLLICPNFLASPFYYLLKCLKYD